MILASLEDIMWYKSLNRLEKNVVKRLLNSALNEAGVSSARIELVQEEFLKYD